MICRSGSSARRSGRDPGGDRRAQLRQSGGERIAHRRRDRRRERLPDERLGLLARVALAEVDELDPPRPSLAFGLVEPDERIAREPGEDGGDAHQPASRRRSAS